MTKPSTTNRSRNNGQFSFSTGGISMDTTITKRGDITITERTFAARLPGATICTPLRLDAVRSTDTGHASVSLSVSLKDSGAGYSVRRSENRGAGWTRARVFSYETLELACAGARRTFERQLAWLAQATLVAGRPVDAVNL
jgi:hypothetical protein